MEQSGSKVTVKVEPELPEGGHDGAITVTLDPEAVECPVCFHALKPPVFQCSSGHVVCSPCRDMLLARGECPVCSAATAYGRCFAVERILQSVRAACPNCSTQTFLHEREEHEKACKHVTVLPRQHGAWIPADRFAVVLPEISRALAAVNVSVGEGAEAAEDKKPKGRIVKMGPCGGGGGDV